MNSYFKQFIIKVAILSTWIVFVFMIATSAINVFSSSNDENNVNKTNANTYVSLDNQILWKTGVALATNIGIRYTQRQDIPANLYTDALNISSLIQDINQTGTWAGLISTNMAVLQEYKNVLKTDFKSVLDSSYDRAQMLNAIIGQLQYRYELANEQMKELIATRINFETEMNAMNEAIKNLKTKINMDFQNANAESTYENINTFVELKNTYEYARVYITFINQFLNDYKALNDYTYRLLDTIWNNKDAIIKNSYVVIPDTWVEFLRDFNLLYWEN